MLNLNKIMFQIIFKIYLSKDKIFKRNKFKLKNNTKNKNLIKEHLY